MKHLITIVCSFLFGFGPVLASEDHADEGEHKHEEESRFGPTKGVVAADPKSGFQLHEKAYANFKIQLMKLGSSPWRIPTAALVFAKEERHVYRFRSGYFKSVDVKILEKEGSNFVISSDELSAGDQIVTLGTGFLVIVDEAVFGAELSHDH